MNIAIILFTILISIETLLFNSLFNHINKYK